MSDKGGVERVLAHAEYVWDDHEQAHQWMSRPHSELSGMSPFEAARTELGAQIVDELLDKIFFGLPL